MRALVVVVVAFAGCGNKEPAAKPPALLDGIALPQVKLAGYRPLEVHAPLVTASPTAISFDGKPLVTLENATVAAADKVGGERGMKISRLATALAIRMDAEPRPPLQLAIDKSLTYGLLVEIMFSAKQPEAGWKTFELLAATRDGTVAVPITLPDKAQAALGDALTRPNVAPSNEGDTPAIAKSVPTKPIQRCYKELLKTDASARGKVRLMFGVDRTGRVHGGKAYGFAAGVDACIENAMRTWKFPGAGGERDLVEYKLDIQLVPDAEPSTPTSVDQPAAEPPTDMPIELVVSVQQDELLLWSFSQLEGTLGEPKLRVNLTDATALEQVSAALAEIVKRRWPSTRPDSTKTIVLMAARTTSMQRVAEVIGALRPSFPELRFSTGFE